MNNQVTIFNNAEFGSVRTVVIDGEPWFVGKDVCEALGYTDIVHTILDHVDEDDRVNSKTQGRNDPEFGQRGTWLINESGLYSLVLSSKLESAKRFKRWVTRDVIPSIRKTGVYGLSQEDRYALDVINANSKETRMLALSNYKAAIAAPYEAKITECENTIAVKDQLIGEMSPKATYYDTVLSCPDAMPITVIAKDYGKSAQWMNQKLKEYGIQYKRGHIWLLYQEYAEFGYTKSETVVVQHQDGGQHTEMHTKWTQKGRLFIYETFKKHGILPVCEREVKLMSVEV